MAKSPRGRALDALVDLLCLIKPTTYKTNVRTVKRVVFDWHHAPLEGMLPFIGIKPETTEFRYLPGRHMRNVLGVSLGCHLKSPDDEAGYDAMDDLIDDIIAVVDSDMTLGGSCVSLKVVRAVTDEGDPNKMDSRRGIVSAVVTLEIITQRSTASQ